MKRTPLVVVLLLFSATAVQAVDTRHNRYPCWNVYQGGPWGYLAPGEARFPTFDKDYPTLEEAREACDRLESAPPRAEWGCDIMHLLGPDGINPDGSHYADWDYLEYRYYPHVIERIIDERNGRHVLYCPHHDCD